ncbi:dihydrodipicolinate reductase [Paracoccus spongiarum]|uniref:Dihydrodipicolinate reductase n=1 Tax=Paracoccus spongiarum TaxID=3064387 RepID=A0ABT9JDL2_9RHOB|nr:dihydrodipicolinate reductase [Paracoccus sp. 2205BS29-5]MDP5307171.1 dihydrodipicolinate reductase [Paracoccus sp. 2205BS29-5]
MPRLAAAALAAAITALPLTALPVAALAERVTTREAFVGLVGGRDLTSTGITLRVGDDGRISGRAFGREVRGTWTWERGWFCRTLAWGAREWPLNCQLVVRDGERVVFTADKGAGDRATLALR